MYNRWIGADSGEKTGRKKNTKKVFVLFITFLEFENYPKNKTLFKNIKKSF